MHAVQHNEVPKNILAGIFFTFLLIIGAVTSFLIPLPTLFYRIKLGRKNSLAIPAAVILMLVFISKGLSPGIFIYAGWMLLGFLLSEFFEMNLSIERTVLLSSIITMLAGCFALFFYSNMSNTGVYEIASNQVNELLSYMRDAGLIEESPDEIRHVITCSMPGIIASLIIFMSWVNVIIAVPLLKKSQLFFPEFGALNLWKAPERLVWVTIACGVLLVLPFDSIGLIALNIMFILILIYFFQGMAIVSFYVKKIKIPSGLRIFLYWLIFFQFPVNFLVIGIGFFDMWLDFRKISSNTTRETDN